MTGRETSEHTQERPAHPARAHLLARPADQQPLHQRQQLQPQPLVVVRRGRRAQQPAQRLPPGRRQRGGQPRPAGRQLLETAKRAHARGVRLRRSDGAQRRRGEAWRVERGEGGRRRVQQRLRYVRAGRLGGVKQAGGRGGVAVGAAEQPLLRDQAARRDRRRYWRSVRCSPAEGAVDTHILGGSSGRDGDGREPEGEEVGVDERSRQHDGAAARRHQAPAAHRGCSRPCSRRRRASEPAPLPCLGPEDCYSQQPRYSPPHGRQRVVDQRQ